MKKISSILFLITISLLQTFQIRAQQNTFAWAKPIGAQFDDSGYSIVTDNGGNVYTTGYFEGTVDFDPGSGTFNLTSAGLGDIFIQKLSPSGTFLWAKRMGGTGFDYGYSITIDASYNVITTGSFEGTCDFDPGSATINITSNGGHDVFIQKLDQNGNFLWGTNIGGTGEDEGLSVTTDLNQNIIVTGYFSNSVDFNTGTGVNTQTSNGLYDNYIVKFDASGNYLWAVTFGGTNYDYSKSITTDASGNIFTTGTFGGTVDFNPGINDSSLTSNGGSIYGDIYIQKLDATGNFIWVRQMGWFGDDIGTSIKADANGNVYTTGWFQVTVDFDPGAGVANLITNGGGYTDDIFVQKLDGNGNFVWAKNMGGPSDDRGFSLTLDNAGYVCTTGYHSGTGDFDPGTGTSNLTGDGAFLSKLTNAGNFVWAKEMTKSEGHGITSDLVGNLYSTGQFDHTVDFDPGSGSTTLSSNAGSMDAYVQKLNSPSVGIPENVFDISNAIYPNPTRGEFSIDLGKNYTELNIEIKNMTGSTVYKSTSAATSIIKINLDQPAGIYFVSVTSNSLNINYKLIKQ